MPLYQNENETVEAVEVTADFWMDNSGWPTWIMGAGECSDTVGCLNVFTPQGRLEVPIGDYLIEGDTIATDKNTFESLYTLIT
jgi:hypothetical protein